MIKETKENKSIVALYSYYDNKLWQVTTVMVVALLFSFTTQAQIEDCVGAYPVCGNSDISLLPTGTGANDFANPNNNMPDCFRGEAKTTWLRLKIKEAGSLGFKLIPDNLTGANRDDYDFAVYGPNRPCDNLGSAIRCSTTNPQQADVGAETGMNETETDTSEGPGEDGNGFIHWLDDTQVGEVYFIYIDNFSQNAGYTLEWTGTALLEDRITKEDGGVDLGEDLIVCDSDETTLDATTLGGVQYLWNDDSTDPLLPITAAGTYHVRVETASGCVSRDTINIVFADPPEIFSISATPNEGCEPIEVAFSATGSDTDFEWFSPSGASLGTGDNITLSDLTDEDAGFYRTILTNAEGCKDTAQVFVNVHPTYLFDNLVEQCPGTAFTVPQTGAQVFQTDTITVPLLTREGCDSIYVWDVQFLPCADRKCIGFPNAIAPNGNELNEAFNAIFSEGCVPSNFELTIYNRWGEKVYVTNNFSEGWDGSFEGEIAQSGYYLWHMNYSFTDKPDLVGKASGGLTLLR